MVNRRTIVPSTDKCVVSYLFCHVQVVKQPFTWVANLPTTPHHRTGYSVILSKPLLQHTHRREETLPFYQIGFKAAWKPPTSQSHWGEAEHCPFPSGLVDERDLMQQLVVISRHTGNKLARGSGGRSPQAQEPLGEMKRAFRWKLMPNLLFPLLRGQASPPASAPAALLTLAYANCILLGPQMIIIQCNLQLGQFLNYFGNYNTLFCKCLPAKYQMC